MRTINWNDWGASIDLTKAIWNNDDVELILSGAAAAFCRESFGIMAVRITPQMAQAVVVLFAIAVIGGIILYALSNGYDVEGEAIDSEGNKYKFKFTKKSNE
ncbi:hypothetical protein [Desulfatitalea alkaliphila]|uniref:Uncharacterized protein n=1 Tax=Desulfatitalea alkaliphila TaxID=2929485 RepID=A0AA41R679_9BACT|nr:hypothetical protein [Desulfatitalea alkaliphila]MCJ8503139.1 hypothetical protein [Desulfatitalea alkaliphila]